MAMAAPEERPAELERHLTTAAAALLRFHRGPSLSFDASPGRQHTIDQGFNLASLDADIAQRAGIEALEFLDRDAAAPGLGHPLR